MPFLESLEKSQWAQGGNLSYYRAFTVLKGHHHVAYERAREAITDEKIVKTCAV